MDMTAAEQALDYQAPTGYAGALAATVEWIVDELAGRDWREAFPVFLRANGPDAFNYRLEDAWLNDRATTTAT